MAVLQQCRGMKAVRVVLERDLLKAVDKLAARLNVNRSDMVTAALTAYVQVVQKREIEDADSAGYGRHSEDLAGFATWDRIASWPDD
jgi:metal-responsive CopG/Arc/MetJ family transcriptional regulator